MLLLQYGWQVLVSIKYGDKINVVKDCTVSSMVMMAADSTAGGGSVDLGRHSLTVLDTLIYSDGTFTGSGVVSFLLSIFTCSLLKVGLKMAERLK